MAALASFLRHGTSSLAAQGALTVTGSAAPDLDALWAAYQQAALYAQSQWSGYRMMRIASTADGTAGFIYGKAYEAERAADAAYAAFQAAQRRVYAGVTG
jgi:hypothetical protein